MNKIKILTIGFLILAFLILLPNIAFGANASISAGSRTIEKGKSTSISVYISATETWNLKISATGGSLSGTTDSTDASDGETSRQVISANFSANTAGTYTIYLSGQIAGSDLKKQSVSKSITITVTEPVQQQPVTPPSDGGTSGGNTSGGNGNTSSGGGNSSTKPQNNPTNTTTETKKSSDSSLSSIAVAEGVILPEFNKDIKEYSITVPNEVTAINIAATTTDNKAFYSVVGNTDLKEGENIVTITVRAEDDSTTDYVIKVTRARPQLSLNSLILKYKNESGELIEIPLNPAFNFNTFEYTIEDLEYWVEKLEIQAIANIENATIDIQGNGNLKEGQNEIIITVKVPTTIEGEIVQEGQISESEEVKVYTIKLNKKVAPEQPTLMGKISNWFNGISGGISAWYFDNQIQLITGALGICIIALIGLSIYIIVDYKNYKVLIEKLQKLNGINAESSLEVQEEGNILEDIAQDMDKNNKNDKPKGGRHF